MNNSLRDNENIQKELIQLRKDNRIMRDEVKKSLTIHEANRKLQEKNQSLRKEVNQATD